MPVFGLSFGTVCVCVWSSKKELIIRNQLGMFAIANYEVLFKYNSNQEEYKFSRFQS